MPCSKTLLVAWVAACGRACRGDVAAASCQLDAPDSFGEALAQVNAKSRVRLDPPDSLEALDLLQQPSEGRALFEDDGAVPQDDSANNRAEQPAFFDAVLGSNASKSGSNASGSGTNTGMGNTHNASALVVEGDASTVSTATVSASGCATQYEPTATAGFFMNLWWSVAAAGTPCVFDKPGSACAYDGGWYGAFGWCWTDAEQSSWGACSPVCNLDPSFYEANKQEAKSDGTPTSSGIVAPKSTASGDGDAAPNFSNAVLPNETAWERKIPAPNSSTSLNGSNGTSVNWSVPDQALEFAAQTYPADG